MKTLIYLNLIAFLLLSGCAKNDDETAVSRGVNQLKDVPENGTVSYFFTAGIYTYISCDGVEIGTLEGGVIEWHILDHYKNGEPEWSMYKAFGTLTDQSTGEVFQIQESDKVDYNEGDFTFHSNIIGDQGSHYILAGTGLWVYPYTVTIYRANCPGE
jgi:hypothetical protein